MLLVINQYYNKDNFLTAIVAQPDVKAGISEQKGQAVIGTRHHLAEFILNIINIKATARITGCQKNHPVRYIHKYQSQTIAITLQLICGDMIYRRT